MDLTTSPPRLDRIDADATVAELVTRVPARARVFEGHGIDYCCGGRVPLRDAAAERGIDLDEMLEELARVDAGDSSERDWSEASIGELCEHIVEVHHGFLRRELPRMSTLVAKVARAHGARHAELTKVEQEFEALADELLDHIAAEERDLFSVVSVPGYADRLDDAGAARIIEHFEDDHEATASRLRELRRLTADFVPPADACTSYRAMLDGLEELERDVHQHVHEENHVLFPRVADALARRA